MNEHIFGLSKQNVDKNYDFHFILDIFWWMKNILFEICFFFASFHSHSARFPFFFSLSKKGEFLLLIHRVHGELRGGIDL